MTSTLTPEVIGRLSDKTDDQLLARLEECLHQMHNCAAETGLIILELKKRGKDISLNLRGPVIAAVKKLADGLLTKEAFAALYARPDLVRQVACMPPDRQKGLIEKGAVEVVEFVGKETTNRMIELDELRPEQIRVVFDKGRVRSVQEQAAFINSAKVKEGLIRPQISHDPQTNILDCKNVTFAQVAAYAKKHGLD